MASDNIFTGLKVVDLASFIAGPSAAVILSDFGADVIKVEPPTGDVWRMGHRLPPQPQAEEIAMTLTDRKDPLFSEIAEARFELVRKHILQLEQEAEAERRRTAGQ